MTAVVVFAHGSPVQQANEPVRSLAREVAQRGGYPLSLAAFLDCADPDLPGAVRQAVESGATRIVVVPFFLTLGLHLKRDLPRIVAELRDIYKGVEIVVAPPLEGHGALVAAVLDRAKETIDGGSSPGSQTR